MPLLSGTHIPVIVTSGPVVGVAAMLVAAVTTVPLAYLYETGGNTVWAPAVVHTAIDSFKLVVIPAAAVTTFSPALRVQPAGPAAGAGRAATCNHRKIQ